MRHWLTAVLCFVSLPLWAEGEAAAGAEKAARCMACHGAEGKSAIPPLSSSGRAAGALSGACVARLSER